MLFFFCGFLNCFENGSEEIRHNSEIMLCRVSFKNSLCSIDLINDFEYISYSKSNPLCIRLNSVIWNTFKNY